MSTSVLQKLTASVYWQFIKFALAGAFCAVIELNLFLFLDRWTDGQYTLTVNACAYAVAVIINYLISRAWIFEAGRYNPTVEFVAFAAVATVGLGINQTVLYYAKDVLGEMCFNTFGVSTTDKLMDYDVVEMGKFLGKIAAIAVVVLWNFTAKKFIVFKG